MCQMEIKSIDDTIEHPTFSLDLLSGNRKITYDYNNLLKQAIETDIQPPMITTDDIQSNLLYFPNERTITPNLHIGQRKLFLSELEFLTIYFTQNSQVNPIVLYVGAAPSNHTYYLSQLFPNVKFILVDSMTFHLFIGKRGNSHRKKPNKLIVHLKTGNTPYNGNVKNMDSDIVQYITESNARIFIIEDIFTDELAYLLKPLNCLFISDIRTRHKSAMYPLECDVVLNLAQQYIWVNILNPPFYMLKFRQPFYTDKINPKMFDTESYRPTMIKAKAMGISFVENYMSKKLVYLKGKFHLQCFPGQKSTETRLISNTLNITTIDIPAYESKLYFYNCIARGYTIHKNNIADNTIGFDHCNDCAKEAQLWHDYCFTIDTSADPIELVKQLSIITYPLVGNRTSHGYFFGATNLWLKSQIRKM